MKNQAFTLVELLVALVAIVLLAGVALYGMKNVDNNARVAKTKALVSRIDEIVSGQWQGYRTRPVPFDPTSLSVAARTEGKASAAARLFGLRELMRMEMPDRVADVRDPPNTFSFTMPPRLPRRPAPVLVRFTLDPPALWRSYRAHAASDTIPPPSNPALDPTENWTTEHQGAECLYLIVKHSQLRYSNGLDRFKGTEIGDIDGDGMKEFIDAWGNPIEFVRWAPGFTSDKVTTFQHADAEVAPDQFDMMRVDSRWPMGINGGNSDPDDDPFALWPLVFSAGPDEQYDIVRDFAASVSYSDPSLSPIGSYADPYISDPNGVLLGWPMNCSDATGKPVMFGKLRFADNISNHSLDSRH